MLRRRLGLTRDTSELRQVDEPRGPGNVLWVTAECESHTEMFVDFGMPRRSAESVGEAVADAVESWRAHGAPVGEHLADQLIPLVALAGAGCFVTGSLSSHARTNLETVELVLGRSLTVASTGAGDCVSVSCEGPRR